MQALENLTETQVNDFLSGRSPLMLAIRMGDNMVFVQLQLSMLQGQGQTQGQGPPQPRPSMTPINPATAAVLSQTRLSPSAIAEATRCLSQRLHRLHEMNRATAVRPTPNLATPAVPRLSQPPAVTSPRQIPPPLPRPSSSSVTTAPAPSVAAPSSSRTSPTMFQLPLRQHLPTIGENPLPSPPPSPGAIIDSMKHLGHGVYTGTFQGTLDPSLQDGNGQPRRSVNTILHILNDLLVAAPNSPTPSSAQGQPSSSQHGKCQCHAPSLPLTPPSSPISRTSPASSLSPQEDSDNLILKGKMQRIQMMLAQRKEQRRNRREMSAPYNRPSQKTAAAATTAAPILPQSSTPSSLSLPSPSSSSPTSSTKSPSSVCMAATASTTSAADGTSASVANHGDGNSEQSSTYCKPNIEQDSLAV